jgi:hypothetical protein
MLIDYAYFGDVVSFDATFGTNKESRYFDVFVGFNHFRKTMVFGVVLVYDETFESLSSYLRLSRKRIMANNLKQSILIKMLQWEKQLRRSFLSLGMVCALFTSCKMLLNI